MSQEEKIVQIWSDSLKDFDFDFDNPFPILSKLISRDLGKSYCISDRDEITGSHVPRETTDTCNVREESSILSGST